MTVRRREFHATIPVALASATAFARQGDVNEALRAFLQPHVLKRSTKRLISRRNTQSLTSGETTISAAFMPGAG